jgi:hypothetical protein
MGGDEQNQIELTVREPVAAAATLVEDKIVEVASALSIDPSAVKPIVAELSQAATTVVENGVKDVVAALGLKMISESSLTEEQKKLANLIYDSTKAAIQSFINDASLNNTVKITKTLGQVIKQLERPSLGTDGVVPTGADKKAVAIQLGRILIKEVMPDDKGEKEVLMVYDLIAEPTLEAMIDVSRVVNVAVQEMATKCCPGLLDLFKRYKNMPKPPVAI